MDADSASYHGGTGGTFWFWQPENLTISLEPFDLLRLLMIILNVMIT